MALPSGTNPHVVGQLTSNSYEAEHGNGICSTTVTLSGSTVKYFFGSSANNFRGTVTGVFLAQIVGTSQTVTVKGTGGQTICTITGSATAGSLKGPNAALSNTAIDLNGTVSVSSTNAVDVSLVTITYKTDVA